MRNNIKALLLERVSRVKYIKTELTQLIEKSVSQNKTVKYKIRIAAKHTCYVQKNKFTWASRHRMYCMLNASTKSTNKKLQLSRFSLNSLANHGQIAGFMKRG